MSMRTKIIAGNWKMNTTAVEAEGLVRGILEKVSDVRGVDIVVCPPFTSLAVVSPLIGGSNVALGAQNMHWEDKGAYTGEVSATMLLTLGCQFVILGHSERRSYFFETDEVVAQKAKAAISSGLIPIVCVGETLDERERELTNQVVERQVTGAFRGMTPEEFNGIVVAYEPVWAIGTGKTATTEQAQEVHAFIRDRLSRMFGEDVAGKTRIQYGGSMKPENAAELLAQADIDGGLIGGASLKADSFEEIIRAAL